MTRSTLILPWKMWSYCSHGRDRGSGGILCRQRLSWHCASLTCQWKFLAGWKWSAERRPGATVLWDGPVRGWTGRRTSADTSREQSALERKGEERRAFTTNCILLWSRNTLKAWSCTDKRKNNWISLSQQLSSIHTMKAGLFAQSSFHLSSCSVFTGNNNLNKRTGNEGWIHKSSYEWNSCPMWTLQGFNCTVSVQKGTNLSFWWLPLWFKPFLCVFCSPPLALCADG